MPVRSNHERWQVQKLEALGQVSAGIAHELSTPLQSLGDTLQFLQEAHACLQPYLARLPESGSPGGGIAPRNLGAEISLAIEEALEGVARAREIVHAVKTLAHPGTTTKSAADLNRLVEGAIMLAANRIRPVAVIRTDLASLPPVVCQPGLLQQVALNLLLNAADAIEEKSGRDGQTGIIEITTSCVGPWAVLTVTDSGSGISREVAPNIFTPFFTTKQAGAGTGQGLAIARAIVVEEHGGSLDFVSEPGKGATFRVRLPMDDRSRLPSPRSA